MALKTLDLCFVKAHYKGVIKQYNHKHKILQ